MLLQYDRQLVTARRLARIIPKRDANGPAGRKRQTEAEIKEQAEKKRRDMIMRIARELLDNLLFAGSTNPVVEEIRQELNRKLERQYSFWYPPGEIDVHIVHETSDGPEELTSEERKRVLTVLWEITLAKVDETML